MAKRQTKRPAKKTAKANSRKKRGSVQLACIVMAIALLLGMSIRAFGVTLVLVRSEGMQPTLMPGDIVLLSRTTPPQVGSVVLAGARNGSFFRRVIAQPGDTVAGKSETIYRNGLPLLESYARGALPEQLPETQLSSTRYLLLADDRTLPGGIVEAGSIAGTAVWILWPIGRIGSI